jgi:hypothetical protein
MTRRGLLLLCALAALTAAAPVTAVAQDGGDGKKPADKGKPAPKKPPGNDGEKPKGKDGEKKKDPKPEDTPQGKVLLAIGKEFREKRHAALVARMRPKGRLSLEFKSAKTKKGEFKRSQAEKILKTWFGKRTIVALKLERVKGDVGTFKLTVRVRGSDAKTITSLRVELLKHAKGYHLHKIKET